MDDINQIRALFPITQTHAYLNNPAIGPLSRTAHAAAVAFLDERMLSPWPDPAPSGLLRLRDRKNRVRTKFAQLHGAHPHEVGLVESTSAGENMVAQALLQPGDIVVVDDLHFESSFLLYRQLEASRGITLRIVPSRNGVVDIADLAAAIDARTKLVSLSWVSNRNGFRHDIKAVADLAHSHGAYLYVDAIQALFTFPADFHALDIDFLTCGGYKWLYANFGVSFFYIKAALLPLVPSDRFGHTHVASASADLHFTVKADASKYEYAAIAHTSVAQLEGALDLITQVGLANIGAHGIALAHYLWHELDSMGYELFTPPNCQSAIVTFAHGQDAQALSTRLAQANVAVLFRENDHYIRAGTGFYNTREDVDRLLEVLRR